MSKPIDIQAESKKLREAKISYLICDNVISACDMLGNLYIRNIIREVDGTYISATITEIQLYDDLRFLCIIQATLPKNFSVNNSTVNNIHLERTNVSKDLVLICPKLKQLSIVHCNLTKFPKVPSSVTELTVENNKLTALPALPEKLQFLMCSYNNIKKLPILPEGLRSLNCVKNRISGPLVLPEVIRHVDCRDNMITKIVCISRELNTLVCSNNKIKALPKIIYALDTLVCDKNNITAIPDLPSGCNVRCDEITYNSISSNSRRKSEKANFFISY